MPFTKTLNIRLYYEVHGQGEYLLLLHGLGSSTQDWEYQVKALSTQYTVITMDMRGHGQSDKPDQTYSMIQFATDVANLLDELKIKKTHVTGISLGGMVALQFATDFSQRVNKLVIVNAAADYKIRTLRQRTDVIKRFAIVRLFGMRKIGEVLANKLLPADTLARQRTQFIERWANNDKRSYMASMRAIVGWSVEDKLSAIQTPVLVISSEYDSIPLENKQRLVDCLPRAKLEILKGLHHAAPVEDPESFNRTLLSFLGQTSG